MIQPLVQLNLLNATEQAVPEDLILRPDGEKNLFIKLLQANGIPLEGVSYRNQDRFGNPKLIPEQPECAADQADTAALQVPVISCSLGAKVIPGLTEAVSVEAATQMQTAKIPIVDTGSDMPIVRKPDEQNATTVMTKQLLQPKVEAVKADAVNAEQARISPKTFRPSSGMSRVSFEPRTVEPVVVSSRAPVTTGTGIDIANVEITRDAVENLSQMLPKAVSADAVQMRDIDPKPSMTLPVSLTPILEEMGIRAERVTVVPLEAVELLKASGIESEALPGKEGSLVVHPDQVEKLEALGVRVRPALAVRPADVERIKAALWQPEKANPGRGPVQPENLIGRAAPVKSQAEPLQPAEVKLNKASLGILLGSEERMNRTTASMEAPVEEAAANSVSATEMERSAAKLMTGREQQFAKPDSTADPQSEFTVIERQGTVSVNNRNVHTTIAAPGVEGEASTVLSRIEVFAKVNDAVRPKFVQLAGEGGGKVKIELHPPELGKIDLTVSVDRDTAKAHFVAQEIGVAEALKGGMHILKAALEQHGIVLQEFDVAFQDQSESRNHRQEAPLERQEQECREERHGTFKPGRPAYKPSDGSLIDLRI